MEEREWGNDRERRRRRERGRGNIPPEPSLRRASHASALTLGGESGDEEAATSNSNIGNDATRAVPAAGTGATTTTTTEQVSPTPEAGGAGWPPHVVGIGVVVTPFMAVSMGTALGCASAAAGVTAIVNSLSNNNRAVQESHDRRMIAEAQIDAARDVEKHKATVQAREWIVRRMVDEGQYGLLNVLQWQVKRDRTVTFNLFRCNLNDCISNFQRYTLEPVLATPRYGGREESRMGEARTRRFVDGLRRHEM